MTDAGSPGRLVRPPTALAVACLVAAGVYVATLGFGFAYDDVPIIVHNPVVHELSNWQAVFAARWWNDALYRPLTLFSFAVDWALSGGRPFFFHLVNVLLHVANTAGVYLLAHRTLGSRGAGIASLLFAAHPVHVEAVANVVGRAELLATFGVLVAALAYRAEANSQRRVVMWLVAIIASLAAFASKESAFALPALLLVLDWLDAAADREPFLSRMRRRAPLWIAVVGVWGAWLTIWFARAGHLPPTVAPGLEGLSVVGRAGAMLPVIPQYARLLFVPVHLSADYSPRFLVAGATDWYAALGIVTLAAAATVVIGCIRTGHRAVAAGVLWAAAALLVVSNVAFPSEILLAERTMYLPSVGAVVAVAAAGEWILARYRMAESVAFGLLMALGCARIITRVPVWRDSQTLFASIVRDAPGSYRADWLDGMFRYTAGDRRGGLALLERAAGINPRDAGLLNDLANRLEEDSMWNEAGARFAEAYRDKPVATLYAARAIDDFVRARAPQQAEAVALDAWPRDSVSIPLRIARSDLAEATGDYGRATDLRLGVARQAPGVWQYWLMEADVAGRAGRCDAIDEALAHIANMPAAHDHVRPLAERRKHLRCTR